MSLPTAPKLSLLAESSGFRVGHPHPPSAADGGSQFGSPSRSLCVVSLFVVSIQKRVRFVVRFSPRRGLGVSDRPRRVRFRFARVRFEPLVSVRRPSHGASDGCVSGFSLFSRTVTAPFAPAGT